MGNKIGKVGAPNEATVVFSNNTLMLLLKQLRKQRGLEFKTPGGIVLHTLKPAELAPILNMHIGTTAEHASANQRFFDLLGKVEATCADLGETFTRAKKTLSLPLRDLPRLENARDRADYFGPMLSIIIISRKLETQSVVTLQTTVEKDADPVELLSLLKKGSLMPFFTHLRDLAQSLSTRAGKTISITEMKEALELWAENAAENFMGHTLNFDTMVFDLVAS